MTHSAQPPTPPVSTLESPEESLDLLPPPPPPWSPGEAGQRAAVGAEPVAKDGAAGHDRPIAATPPPRTPERRTAAPNTALVTEPAVQLASGSAHGLAAALADAPTQTRIPPTAVIPSSGRWSRWQNLGLRFKATVVVLALVLLPVAGLGVAATGVAGRSLETKIKELEEDATRGSADKVAFFLKERYGDIQALANSDFLRNPVLLEGKLRTPDQEAAKLDQFLLAYGVYDSIAVYDRQGNFRIQSRSQGTPRENIRAQGEQPYFQQVLETGQPFMSQPFIPEDVDLAKYSIFLAAPIRSNGQIVGVVRARMPVRYMSNVLASQQRQGGSSLTLYLVDSEGIVFASSSNQEAVTDTATELNAQTIVPDFPRLQDEGDIQTLALKDSVIAYVPLNQVGQAFEGELPDLGWSTLATIPQAEAFVPIRNLRTTLIVGTLGAMVGIGLLVVGVVNRFVQPLAAARMVNRIGQGDLKARLVVQGKDEIAQLGSNINSMAGQIEQLLLDQAKVADKAQFLANISSFSVSSAHDLNPLFTQALKGTQSLLGVDQLALYQVAPGEPVLLGEANPNYSLVNQALPPCGAAHLYRYRSGEPLVMANVLTAEVEIDYYQWLSRLQVKASLEIPLETADHRLIILMVQDYHSTRNWQPSHINFVRELANRLATAMSRVSFLEQINTARQQAEGLAVEQTNLKEGLQRRALELLMEVDPVSQGDLTIRARVTEDEIGTVADSYNATIESLRRIVQQVQTAADQVTITARTSESAVGKLSTGATTQTQELATALQRIEDMAQSIQEVATNAQAAEVAVQQANQTVQEGDEAMNRTVDGILAIRETVGETAKKVKRLGESSQRISKVVNLISSFAAQTNLLALNASIEAARAGEDGRGFAVVADEVRSLARQSAEATAEIEKLVAGIQAETQEVVAAMEAGTEQVVTGTQLVDATRQSLSRISSTSQNISRLVDAIATAAAQQSTASSSVTQSMTGLATIADQTSTEAEQVAQSFQQLLTVAQTLQAEVSRFKVS